MEGAGRHGITELVADPDAEAAAKARSSTARDLGSSNSATSELGITQPKRARTDLTRGELSLE
jgi:hypothetical protein